MSTGYEEKNCEKNVLIILKFRIKIINACKKIFMYLVCISVTAKKKYIEQ